MDSQMKLLKILLIAGLILVAAFLALAVLLPSSPGANACAAIRAGDVSKLTKTDIQAAIQTCPQDIAAFGAAHK